MAPDGWLPLAQTAREAGVSERTMRRRMLALHHQLGGGVLRSYHPPGKRVRKWWVNPAALRSGLALEPNATDVALGEHLMRIEDLEKKLVALRNSHLALKRRLKSPVAAPEKSPHEGHGRSSSATGNI